MITVDGQGICGSGSRRVVLARRLALDANFSQPLALHVAVHDVPPRPRGWTRQVRATTRQHTPNQRTTVRSTADDSVTDLAGRGSVLARQKRDHVELNRLLEQVQRTRDDEQGEVLTQMWRLVFRHAYAEETVLWPAMRATLPDGDALTLHVEQEHQEINELAAALDHPEPPVAERQELIRRVIDLLRQDVRDEEDLLLPRLAQAMSTRQLHSLGLTWELVRRVAPTRPHPRVSRRPPGNALAALPLAMLDHSRDAFDRVARSSRGAPRGAAIRASQLLASAAAVVERTAALRQGEDPSTHARRTTVKA
jgi:hemerythrin superfamily protein